MKAMMIKNGDPKKISGKQGAGAMLIRNKKGEVIGRHESENYAGVNDKSLAADRKVMAGTGSGHYTGSAAPRTGGTSTPSSGVPIGGTKKQIKFSKARVKKSAASPAAKKSAMMLYRKG